MNWLQIVFLLGGIIVFIVSFILPEKNSDKNDEKKQREQIQKMVDEQLKSAKEKLTESVDETVAEAVEKAERNLERVSNEKIMAVNEYSDTVLQDINKNHEEAVFLYSMLNDKHDNIKSTVASMEQSTKEAKKAVHEVNQAKEAVMSVKEAISVVERAEAGSKTGADDTAYEVTENGTVILDGKETSVDEIYAELFPEKKGKSEDEIIAEIANKDVAKADKKSESDIKEKKPATKKKSTTKISAKKDNISMPTFSGGVGQGNHNEKILALHNEGKSNVAIAKELGLGVGEVKLVIDLYQQS
ncbi:MAG: hypothetical protein E7284_04555 [Lachnospiraceae bacterium]|nr:hypothetical protein [Lachnospiraceae bacterium]